MSFLLNTHTFMSSFYRSNPFNSISDSKLVRILARTSSKESYAIIQITPCTWSKHASAIYGFSLYALGYQFGCLVSKFLFYFVLGLIQFHLMCFL